MTSVASANNTGDHSGSTNVQEIKVMEQGIDHDTLDQALRHCGATWDASQTHGLLSGRLAIAGADSGFDWLTQVLEGTNQADALRVECEGLLGALFATTYQQLAERLSAFTPLLPGDEDSPALRATALAHWCEGFLHGLVSGEHGAELRARLQAEPLADIIRDMLQITRAVAEEDDNAESDEEAYFELVEYVRVAAQLAFEELSDLRQTGADPSADSLH
jgi:yecA family protein